MGRVNTVAGGVDDPVAGETGCGSNLAHLDGVGGLVTASTGGVPERAVGKEKTENPSAP